METVKRYTIDDLPAFSSWPARLLGLEAWSPRQKTAAEVIREYDHEKWGALLMRMDSAPAEVTVDDVERWSLEGVAQSLCSVGDRVELLSPAAGRQRHILMVESVLRRYLPASALVELGAGYGSIILRVSREREFADLPLFAGEYTASGIELIRRLSQAEGIPMTVGRCDLGSNRIVNFAVPEGALVFTSMAVHYIPLLSTDYVQGIAALRPSVVVNIEPCYEHCDSVTLTGVLRRRYIEVNDYNRNLVSLLRAQQAEGALRILEELPAVLGVNPLLPVSVIVWSPRQ
jgi:hypothetical protein